MRYVIYLSRSLRYTDKDDIVRKLLQNNIYFDCEFRMVSDFDASTSSDSEDVICAAAWSRMESADVILILAGVYPIYKKWIDSEVRLAKKRKQQKKLIFIEVFDQTRTNEKEIEAADRIVKMNKDAIVDAIRDLCTYSCI